MYREINSRRGLVQRRLYHFRFQTQPSYTVTFGQFIFDEV